MLHDQLVKGTLRRVRGVPGPGVCCGIKIHFTSLHFTMKGDRFSGGSVYPVRVVARAGGGTAGGGGDARSVSIEERRKRQPSARVVGRSSGASIALSLVAGHSS